MTPEHHGQLGGDAYQVTETVAILQRCIWRRARDLVSGSTVLLHSLRSGVAEPRRILELELAKWRRVGTLAVSDALCEVEGELSLVAEDFAFAPLTIPERGLELGLCLDLAHGMARLLNRLHEHGLVHTDVSPGSFLVELATRRVEFADLLAVSEGPPVDLGPAFAPSLAYVAPERTGRLDRRTDHRADYYSLGVTLFQMLTGKLPFTAADAIGWAHAHTSKRAPLVTEYQPGLSRTVAELVAKLLAKDPDERYQSDRGLLSDLSSLREQHRQGRESLSLTLGLHDVSSRFTVSRDVVGREAELSALSRALDDARSGGRRLVLLSGRGGAGKSAVVAEFLRRNAGAPVRFLSTAFEEHAQAVPLSGLTLTLRGFSSELLSLSESELSSVRERVGAALGQNAGVLAELVPAISCITGPASSVVALNPLEAQRRLQHAFVSFVRVFATPERPLAFVLDDCQWLDAASADVLSALLTSLDSSHVLMAAAFRGQHVADVPALLKMQQALESTKETAVELSLGPLSSLAVAEIVARSLRAPVVEVRELAELLTRKTNGKPFFIHQTLASLHADGVLGFDVERGRWSADLQRAEAHPACDNVGASMAQRLERVSAAAVKLLSTAACFGMRFDLPTLSATLELPCETCVELIQEALAQRLISEFEPARAASRPEPSSADHEIVWYVFDHSRIQQAASSRLDQLERVEIHARIGRILRRRLTAESPPSHAFAVLRHLNAARGVIHDPTERVDLLELNLAASKRGLQTGAFGIASAHAEIALELIDDRTRSPELAFQAMLARAESAFLLADPGGDGFCEQAFSLAPDALARARVHVLKTRILEHGGRMAEAVVQVRTALGELGVRLPETPDEINRGIGEGIGKLQAHLSRVTVEGLPRLPRAEDAESRVVLELLAQVIPPAFQTYPPLFILAELIMFDLSLTRGVDAVSCKNFADCSIILMAFLGDYDTAYRLGQAAFELLERFSPTPVEAGVGFVFAGFLSHWKEPYQEVFAVYDRAEKSGLALGDLQHVAYTKNDRIQRSFLTGARLRACREQVVKTRRYLTHISATGQLVNTLVVDRASARLMASESEKEAVAAADRDAMAVLVAEKSAQYCYAYGQAQLMTSFILGDFADAQRWLDFTREFLMIAPGQFSLPDYQLLEALLAVRAHDDGAAEVRETARGVIEKNLQQLQNWAKMCPENFAHKYHFLAAEHARITSEPLQVVLAHYRDALRTAGDGFMQLRALVHEHQARLWLSLDEPLHARTCLETAYRLYADWGASSKLELLARQYPAMLADVIGSDGALAQGGLVAGHGFDAASVLKATQSIFVEVESERLFAALMAILIENAGAEHGCLILRDETDGKYYVEARAHVDRPITTSSGRRVAYPEEEYLCPSVVSYALRTGESVTLDDAGKAGAFTLDPRVRERGVRSVLCAPIKRQGVVMGALYVENNVSAYAFTRQRSSALRVIASQAAISIYNAQLYESLERRVAQRTEELALKNRQIASMLDNLDQGVFTIDATERIEPGYSRRLPDIFGTTDLVGRSCLELLTDGSALRPAILSAAQAALSSSFGQEQWLAELNAEHLIREVERKGRDGESQFLEVSWNFIASEAGLVERLLVTVRDVTLLRRLRQAARNKEREIEMIVQVLDCGLDAMRVFCENCRERLAENRASLATGVEPLPQQIAAAFRSLHTLKGDARLHGLTHLVDSLHAAEDAYNTLRLDPSLPLEEQALLLHLNAVERMVDEYEKVANEKLAFAIKKSDDPNQRILEDIRTLLASASSSGAGRDLLPELSGILSRFEQTSVAHLVEEASVMLPSLAGELGKPAPAVQAQQVEATLAGEWPRLVKDVLIQAFRNSLYHGIEMPAARELSGKPRQGSIHVRARRTQAGLEVQIFDDGRGLALSRLRAREGNHELSDDALAEQIFLSGVSTAETVGQVAGRGVGLDIVRTGLQTLGGDVAVRFTGEERDGYRPFMLVILMPKSALSSRSGERPSVRPPSLRDAVRAGA
jgi:predicted ATPase/GAF domain-containing protein/HPt (histidine-containing phosphotransfer) domain-containing protein